MTKMLRGRLTRAGFTVVVAPDGEQGLARAASEAPDLIVMDLTLPVLDGWEATRRLKVAPETRAIPVIGCDDYDTKPVDFPRLLEKIRALLAKGAQP